MIGAARVRRVAEQSGFRSEIVEKVLYLEEILSRLTEHRDLEGAWVLKGGTALNLFHFDVPRLSVDLDINYVGESDLEKMQKARERFERGIVAACERAGCSVRRRPREHAGGKFHLRYAGGIGGGGNLEVDVAYLHRVPLLGVESRSPRFPGDAESLKVPLLSIEEIAAGKLCALIMRKAARDAYDAWQLTELVPGLITSHGFRVALLAYAASGRKDVRKIDRSAVRIEMREVRTSILPLLRLGEDDRRADAMELTEVLDRACSKITADLLRFSPTERAFLDAVLEKGQIIPELLTSEAELSDRVHRLPALQWKAQNVRQLRERGYK